MHAFDDSLGTDLGDEIKLPPADDAGSWSCEAPPNKKRKSKAVTLECTVCGITCNSDVVYEAHIKGQKHLKKLNAIYDKPTSQTSDPDKPILNETVNEGSPLNSQKSVIKQLNILANYNKTSAVFTTTGEPSPADSTDSKSTSTCYEVKLTIGEHVFISKGSSVKEAQNLASLMALDCSDFKRPTDMEPSPTSSKLKNTISKGRFVTKRLFPINGYNSAVVSNNKFSVFRNVPTNSDVDKFIEKHLIPSTSLRHSLHSLADYTIRTLIEAANSLATHYSGLGKKRFIDNDLIEMPPSLLDPVRLTQLSLDDYARLLWAIRVGPFTVDLISKHDRTVQIFVIFSELDHNSEHQNNNKDDTAKSIIDEVKEKIPEAEVVNQMLVLKRKHKHQNVQIELTAEVCFICVNTVKVAPFELRRQLWIKQHLARNKVGINTIRILKELSRINNDGLDLIPSYTWEILVNLVSDVESLKKCPSVVCASVLSKIAGGMFLNCGLGLSDPCAEDTPKWSLIEPFCAGLTDVSIEQRVKITKAAQKILNEVIHPLIKSGKDFLQALLAIKDS
ncbi:hypothetical protein GJ496_008973 [Pomphorhynchus laevis]|nr:hypothetical protein GJ496_008973 [Pomphorhynchus laevis]